MTQRTSLKFPLLAALAFSIAGVTPVQAGSIYLTGHDVLLHSGQNSYDNVILDYLRGTGTASEIAAGSYDIGFVRGFSGFVGTVGVDTLEGFGTITTRDLTSFADAADFSAFLSGVDVLVIPDHTSCGGCDLTSADADILESFSAQITSFFNAGGDIFAGSGAADPTFYNFLPPTAVATGASISGSSGFVATAAGLGIGITSNMINGFPTHNRFTSFDPDFTVFETRSLSGVEEIISLGIRDAVIDDGGIGGGGGDGGTDVPEPGTLALLLGLGAVGLGFTRRSTKR